MNGHVYGLSEIVGTSAQGVDDAIRVGIERAARTVRGLDWFEVTDIRGHLVDGEIEHFQVTLKIGYSGWRIPSRAERLPASYAPASLTSAGTTSAGEGIAAISSRRRVPT